MSMTDLTESRLRWLSRKPFVFYTMLATEFSCEEKVRMCLFTGKFVVKTGESDCKCLKGTHRIAIVQREDVFRNSAKLNHYVVLCRQQSLAIRSSLMLLHCISVILSKFNNITIRFMDNLKVFYGCLCNSSMKIQNV